MTETLPQPLLLAFAEKKQQRAADPSVSAWVRANAGTGKTHVLVQRILRLLLTGANPRSILCLTFTKNAAAEMEGRVLSKLGEWAASGDRDLETHLGKLLARPARKEELLLARCLFATVIDGAGGLAIMTIHGFCERVLRRYSLEANVPPGFFVMTEEEARDALSEACSGAFASASSEPLAGALACAVAHANESEFARVLQAMLAKRNEIAHVLSVSDAEDPFPAIEIRLRRVFNLSSADTRQSLIAQSSWLLDPQVLKDAIAVLLDGTKTDCDAAKRFDSVRKAADGEAIFKALKDAFFTKSGEPRKSLMTASLKKRAEALHDRLIMAQAAFTALDAKICGVKLTEASLALLRLAVAIFERYEEAKRARGALDFDDLISKTSSLLSREEAAEWVLYELDARIDHILVDEAQDTSPLQWAIIEKLTSDFFAGQGARDCVPTLFAVGDEKQSIYGFQGAVPELLAHNGRGYEAKASEAGYDWCAADLDLSFRTLEAVLDAVDKVSRALPDLQDGKPVRHLAYRRERGGLVELWRPERGEKAEKGTVWGPEDEAAPAPKPSQLLADRIAAQIKHWLQHGECLASLERPIEPGDILILLRKREPMAKLIQAALKREGIPVAGADRMALIDELAVTDLLGLTDALLQTEDDLSLAAALKSPLFGLSEENLFDLAHGRQGSLWEAVRDNPNLEKTARRLEAWREIAFIANPFGFYCHILEADGGRKAFAARLGPECFDALDEFLALAETFSARPLASLAEFVSFARKSASEVKRETDQAAREVRIMTVHGAKGLEANIVFLADTCSKKSASAAPVFLLQDENGPPPIPVWAVKGTGGLPAVQGAKDRLKDAERRELGRLLYVAMTRARDRLYVSGFHNGSLPEACWYETIQRALTPGMPEVRDFAGRTVWRMSTSDAPAITGKPYQAGEPVTLPAWVAALAGEEKRRKVLSPSKLMDEWNEAPKTSKTDRSRARASGTLIHRLLETLPALPGQSRQDAARLVASAFASELAPNDRDAAMKRVLELLASCQVPELIERGITEAGLAVEERGSIVIGQADRVVFTDKHIGVFDYKSGSLAPEPGSNISRSNLAQLSCYALALRRLYPEAEIRAALFNTQRGTVIEAGESELYSIFEEILCGEG